MHGKLQANITTVETNFKMLFTHKDLACFTESPGGEITKPKHSSTTRIICLTHNRSSSFRPKQLVETKTHLHPNCQRIDLQHLHQNTVEKAIWQPYSYHFPTFFPTHFPKKTYGCFFHPIASKNSAGLNKPSRSRSKARKMPLDSGPRWFFGWCSVKDENDGQKWMQTKCCVYKYYILYILIGGGIFTTSYVLFYIENSKDRWTIW